MGSDTTVRIGTFTVRTDRSEVTDFKKALPLVQIDSKDFTGIPFTYPMRWLSVPAVQSHLAVLHLTSGVFLIQQTFQYEQALEIDSEYELEIELKESVKVAQTEIIGNVRDLSGNAILTMKSVVRVLTQPFPK